MGVITLKIDDDLESRFRRKVSRIFGAGRGSMGKGAETSIRLWLEAPPPENDQEGAVLYRAELNGKKIAKETSLVALADRLKKLGLNPRDVILMSSERRTKVHLGLPTAHIRK